MHLDVNCEIELLLSDDEVANIASTTEAVEQSGGGPHRVKLEADRVASLARSLLAARQTMGAPIEQLHPEKPCDGGGAHRLVLGLNDRSRKSGNVPILCTSCGARAVLHLWGHPLHRFGLKDICKVCTQSW